MSTPAAHLKSRVFWEEHPRSCFRRVRFGFGRVMALTRRTARFGDLAQAIDARLASLDIVVPTETVDRILNHHICKVAEMMRIGDRAALLYAPDDLPDAIAQTIVMASQSETSAVSRHLRSV